jgi:hypothetical protein
MATCATCKSALHEMHRCPPATRVRRVAVQSGIVASGMCVGAAATLLAPAPSAGLMVVTSALAAVLTRAVMKELFLF